MLVHSMSIAQSPTRTNAGVLLLHWPCGHHPGGLVHVGVDGKGVLLDFLHTHITSMGCPVIAVLDWDRVILETDVQEACGAGLQCDARTQGN